MGVKHYKGKFSSVPYFENLFVNKFGVVLFFRNGLFEDLDISIQNKCVYVLYNGDRLSVSLLVLLTYVGKLSADIIHTDGDFRNSNIDNLEYDISNRTMVNNTMYINGEVFKCIPRYSRYYISKDGVIYSSSNSILMRHRYNKGYRTVYLSSDKGEIKLLKIHRLVYSAWIEDIDSRYLINHLNERKNDCNVTNLEKCDALYNTRYSIKSGKKQVPFDYNTVENICDLYSKGYSISDIINKLNLSNEKRKTVRSLIYRIKLKDCYVELSDKYNLSKDSIPSKSTLTENQVHEICRKIVNCRSRNSLAKEYNVATRTIEKIYNRETWKSISAQYTF